MTREELFQMVESLRDTAKLHQPNEEILTDVKAESFIFVMDSVLSALSFPEREKGTDFPQAEDIKPTVESFKRTMDNVDKLMSEEKELVSAAPEREKGEWIKIHSGDKDFPESIVCSKCKNENSHLDFNEHGEPIGKVFATSKFCPNCGADMRGGKE